MSSHSAFYKAYLRSPQWRARSAACLARAGYRCASCGNPGTTSNPLQAHHRNYLTLGNERPCDLQCLCKKCHRRADVQRRRLTRLQKRRPPGRNS